MNEACSRDLLDEYLSSDDVVYDATQIFDALSDLTRFRILGTLSLGEHQLRLLRDRGLVTARRDGRRVIYSLADEHVTTLISVGLLHAAEPVRAGEE